MHRFGEWLLNSQGDDGIWRHRSPLVGHFRDRASGVEFIVTVNHLARGNENIRRRQAGGLRKWAEAQNWSDVHPRLPLDQRTDRYPDSILDFIFVAGSAQQWQAKSWVVVRPGDFPDTDETSDQRPVTAVVELAPGQ